MKKSRNILKKILCVLLLLLSLVLIISNLVFAEEGSSNFGKPDDFKGESDVDQIATDMAASVINVIRVAAATIAIVMLLVIAMKYMMSSAGDRADIKKHAVAYVAGAFILFGAVGILGILDQIGQSIQPTE